MPELLAQAQKYLTFFDALQVVSKRDGGSYCNGQAVAFNLAAAMMSQIVAALERRSVMLSTEG